MSKPFRVVKQRSTNMSVRTQNRWYGWLPDGLFFLPTGF